MNETDFIYWLGATLTVVLLIFTAAIGVILNDKIINQQNQIINLSNELNNRTEKVVDLNQLLSDKNLMLSCVKYNQEEVLAWNIQCKSDKQYIRNSEGFVYLISEEILYENITSLNKYCAMNFYPINYTATTMMINKDCIEWSIVQDKNAIAHKAFIAEWVLE